MSEVTCPRCDPKERSAKDGKIGGNEGYIWWDDATPEEQSVAGAPDGDGEIPCPLCREWLRSQQPPDPAIAGLDWASVPNPDDVPMAKFRFEWVDDDNANVIAIPERSGEPVHIGILAFDADSWCFTRIDRSGTQLVGADTIECDVEAERHLRQMGEESRINAQSEAVLDGHLAAIATHARVYRDDSRDLAVLGATIIARKWWRIFWSPDQE